MQCEWARAILTWTSYQPRHILLAKWGKNNPLKPPACRLLPTKAMPQNAAVAIAQLRCKLVPADSNPLRPAPLCVCNNAPSSARHILMDCRLWSHARQTLLQDCPGPINWECITTTNIQPKRQLRFVMTAGLTRRIRIIMNYDDARDANYELEVDI